MGVAYRHIKPTVQCIQQRRKEHYQQPDGMSSHPTHFFDQ